MCKRCILAVVAVFVLWSVLDFVLHGVILRPTYEATASLWRPENEMKIALLRGVVFIAAAIFCAVYGKLVKPKSLRNGVLYGLLLGVSAGASMGFGSYSYMPIPVTLAAAWFVGSVVEMTAAGLVVGLILTEQNCAKCAAPPANPPA